MHQVTIYHNPRCSNSRGALKLLRAWGIAPQIIEYLSEPLDVATITTLIDAYEGAPTDFVRFKESAAQQADLSPDSAVGSIAQAIVANPILMQRPVVVLCERVLIGRPPESLLPALKAANLSPPSDT